MVSDGSDLSAGMGTGRNRPKSQHQLGPGPPRACHLHRWNTPALARRREKPQSRPRNTPDQPTRHRTRFFTRPRSLLHGQRKRPQERAVLISPSIKRARHNSLRCNTLQMLQRSRQHPPRRPSPLAPSPWHRVQWKRHHHRCPSHRRACPSLPNLIRLNQTIRHRSNRISTQQHPTPFCRARPGRLVPFPGPAHP